MKPTSMKYFFILSLLFFGLQTNAQEIIKPKSNSNQIEAQDDLILQTPIGANKAFEAFIKKEKFLERESPKYKGIQDDKLRWEVTEKVDQIGEEFKKVASYEQPTDRNYNVVIMEGLSSFNSIKSKLTKNDRVVICMYITELMDIVKLPSSKGQLNLFAYGFDKATMKAKKQ